MVSQAHPKQGDWTGFPHAFMAGYEAALAC